MSERENPGRGQKFELIRLGNDAFPAFEEPYLAVPIIPAECLTPFELPVEGSQIANLLRNEQVELSFDDAKKLVSALETMLSQYPGGMSRIFGRTWEFYDPRLEQKVIWQLNMQSSFYDDDIVFYCSLKPYCVQVGQPLELSSEFVDRCLTQLGSGQRQDALMLRVAPGVTLSFNRDFLIDHSLRFAPSSRVHPSEDMSFYSGVSVFRPADNVTSFFSIPKAGEVNFDHGRSSWEESILYGLTNDPKNEERVRWELTIRNCDDGTITTANTGEMPLKVSIGSQARHVGEWNESRMMI